MFYSVFRTSRLPGDRRLKGAVGERSEHGGITRIPSRCFQNQRHAPETVVGHDGTEKVETCARKVPVVRGEGKLFPKGGIRDSSDLGS